MARGSKRTDLTLASALGQFLERTLLPDLRARVEESPAVQRALADALARERAAGRTADDAIAYRERTLEQVGAAWLLDAVFVRFLEDRGFVASRRLAGDGAVDAQERFGAAFPGLAGNAREYLLAVFREAGNLPGARELLGARHDVARRLAPSAAVAADLLRLLREQRPDGSLRWRFDTDDTRVLGDLYQDLSAAVRERYALLQTPDFVESFILDRTLDPALKDFGLDGLRLIDPTCGSGHFLLGAFARLVEAHRRAAPAADPRDHAHAALQHLHGVDLNPFAVAITRFRLLVAYVLAAGLTRLRDAPNDLALDQHVVVADSLLYGGKTLSLASASRDNTQRQLLGGDAFVLEDVGAATRLFGQRYHAVVGNPPYIVCRDSALRERYRAQYPDSASGKFALAAPFTERFFELAVDGGRVGLINANSFMKREFGKGLIEKVLRHRDLTEVVDTSGAYIPGHGTPTVILFGRNTKPVSDAVRVVMGRRGEPETPDDPAQGKVWASIAAHDGEVGFENEFITVADVPRTTLGKHPWSLGGGGASDLKELIETRCTAVLGKTVASIGFMAITGDDEAFVRTRDAWARSAIEPELIRDVVSGEDVRDWATAANQATVFPYLGGQLNPPERYPSMLRGMWPLRRTLFNRPDFGGQTYLEAGRPWFSFHQIPLERLKTPWSITYAEVATHNHFVLDRGGKVFKQTAPIIKLPATATEDDHLALLAWLNSSVTSFFLKQVCYPKGMHNGSESNSTPFLVRHAFDGSKMSILPVAVDQVRPRLIALARAVDSAIGERHADNFALIVGSAGSVEDVEAHFARALARRANAVHRACAAQDEIDWTVYRSLGLVSDDLLLDVDELGPLIPGERPFEVFLGRTDPESITTGWFRWNETSPAPSIPARLPSKMHGVLEARLAAIEASPQLQILESPIHKRRWVQPSGKAAQELESDEKVLRDQAYAWIAERMEDIVRELGGTIVPLREVIHRALKDKPFTVVAEWLGKIDGVEFDARVQSLLEEDSVPYLVSMRFTASGLEKRALWEHTWALQRREDAGESVGDIPVPPKYEREDYRDPRFWSLRGKLDVPRERFIAYPGATTDDAPSPLYGWAGWNHRQRAEALTVLYHRRRDDDGWTGERLVPLLAGLDELIPWLTQWHNTPDAGEDLGAGDAYAAFLATELHAQGITRADLRAWRPAEKAAARAAKAAAKAAATAGDAAPKKRGRPRKDAAE